MAERGAIEVKAQCIGGAVARGFQPEDFRAAVDEALDEPGTGQPVDPGTSTGCPATPLVMTVVQQRDGMILNVRFIR